MLGYNRMTGYNKARYNAEGTELSAADSFTLADGTLLKEILKTISDLFLMADDIAKQQNKSVTDIIKLDVWLSQNRDDSNLWEDE
jgi:hypothetical protein